MFNYVVKWLANHLLPWLEETEAFSAPSASLSSIFLIFVSQTWTWKKPYFLVSTSSIFSAFSLCSSSPRARAFCGIKSLHQTQLYHSRRDHPNSGDFLGFVLIHPASICPNSNSSFKLGSWSNYNIKDWSWNSSNCSVENRDLPDRYQVWFIH